MKATGRILLRGVNKLISFTNWILLKNCALVSKHLHVNSVKWQSYKNRLPWFLNSSKLYLYIKLDIYLSAVLKLYQCSTSAIVFFYYPKKSIKFVIKMDIFASGYYFKIIKIKIIFHFPVSNK